MCISACGFANEGRKSEIKISSTALYTKVVVVEGDDVFYD